MGRKRGPIAALAAALLVVLLALGCQRGKSYRAERFDVDVTLRADGVATITETVIFSFQGGPFTYAFREIPTRRTDGIEGIAVYEDGNPYTLGSGPGQYQVQRRGDDLRVTWHFAPTQNTTRTFTLSYRVTGLIRQEGGEDALRWAAIPPDHDYPVLRSRVVVRLPEAIGPLRRVEVLAGRAQFEVLAGQATFLATQIERDRELTVGVWFPHGQLAGVPPAWQARQLAQAARAPLWVALSGAVLLLGLAASVWAWRRYAHEPVLVPAVTITAPPTALAPGLAAALVHNGATQTHILATLYDLARRGAISIEETEASGGRRPRRRFALRQASYPADLDPFEKATLEAAFARADPQDPRLSLSEAVRGLLRGASALQRQMNAALYEQGLFGRERDRVRRGFLIAGGLVLLLAAASVAIPVVWGALYGAWPLLLTAALILVSVVVLGLGLSVARRTVAGEQDAAHWRAFRRHLEQLARGRAAPASLGELEAYLPYAAAFGLGERWARRLPAPPAWFRALEQEVRAGTDGAAFVAVIAAASASTSAGAGGAAAGGAAGGGASGAG